MNEIMRPDANPPMVAPVTNAGAGTLLNVIAQAAADPTFDLDRLERLFAMQRQVLADEAKNAFQAAMAQAQAEMPSVVKDRENPHLKSKYAQLEAIDDAIRPVYTRHGFSLMFSQRPTDQAGEIVIVCTVLHKGGHSVSEELPGKIDNGPGRSANQAVGSSISYLRRYLTCMIFNVVVRNEDRDGNAPNGDRSITGSQKDALIELMQQTKADTTAFLKFCGVATLDEIKMADYPRALNSLKSKLSKMSKDTSDENH